MGLKIEDIEAQIASEEVYTLGKKTTAVVLTLHNGFEITGTSACVCAADYSQEIGQKYARERAITQLWQLEGYRAQVSADKMPNGQGCCNASA